MNWFSFHPGVKLGWLFIFGVCSQIIRSSTLKPIKVGQVVGGVGSLHEVLGLNFNDAIVHAQKKTVLH